jgi:protein-S-isoprenylcysteine O-methyltransferase Ste14
MFVLIRALTYATLFVALLLFIVPARLLLWSGISRPPGLGVPQAAGILVALAGGALALWCVLTFAVAGRGTPAPFDPPRRLVARGPYRFARNPMYLGATVALGGAALFYESIALAGYTVLFVLVAHGFVIWYEEPHLRRVFADEYRTYCGRVHRWWPALGRGRDPT